MPDSRFFRAPQQEVFHDLSLFGLFEAACVERCVGEAALLLREAYSDSCLFSSCGFTPDLIACLRIRHICLQCLRNFLASLVSKP